MHTAWCGGVHVHNKSAKSRHFHTDPVIKFSLNKGAVGTVRYFEFEWQSTLSSLIRTTKVQHTKYVCIHICYDPM